LPLPPLLRRRTVYVPTFLGWLAIFAVSRPVSARLLVVEGWMAVGQLDRALDVYRAGGYERAITTGGPIEELDAAYPSYAERARSYLLRGGLAESEVVAVPAPAAERDRTWRNVLVLREWILRAQPDVDALDVVTSGVHGRRSWLLHRLAFGPRVRVGVIAVEPGGYDPATWWRTSVGAKDVLGEAISWAWTELFFSPDPPP
jgi:hypothetical protein